MHKIKITVVKKTLHLDLKNKYENDILHTCDLNEGDAFISEEAKMPKGFCTEAWKSVSEFVFRLANGEVNLFDGWMKNPKSALISCNDGIRPVSFLLEVID